VAVLCDVMNPTNLGAIVRSAAAFGVDAVLLTRGCTDPLYRRAIRVSVGTVFQVPWTFLGKNPAAGAAAHAVPVSGAADTAATAAQVSGAAGAVRFLQSRGFFCAAMALTDNSLPLDDPQLKRTKRLALVMGTEGDGLPKKTIGNCDYVVRIPMAHGVDSLNVAAATAVACWELR
jgi:tRNA G18 (ribose-2'-O)-methylase SpoU